MDSDEEQFFDCEEMIKNVGNGDTNTSDGKNGLTQHNDAEEINISENTNLDEKSDTINRQDFELFNKTSENDQNTFELSDHESNTEQENENLTENNVDGVIDTDKIKEEDQKEELLSEEEKEELRKEALVLKESGNKEFKNQKHQEAIEIYTEGLRICPKCFEKERSILYSNRAACHMGLDEKEKAISDCTEAIKLEPNYVRALLRRAQLQEETDKLDESLKDYQQILELDPSIIQARQACTRLPNRIKERNEKLKDEMIGKLKDLGNVVLNKFGLSTDNFQMQQNPDTGGYNVQFVQNPNK